MACGHHKQLLDCYLSSFRVTMKTDKKSHWTYPKFVLRHASTTSPATWQPATCQTTSAMEQLLEALDLNLHCSLKISVFLPSRWPGNSFLCSVSFQLHQVAELVVPVRRQDCTAKRRAWTTSGASSPPWKSLSYVWSWKAKPSVIWYHQTEQPPLVSNNCYGQTRRAFTNYLGRAPNT